MPIMSCKLPEGGTGFKWGDSGKCYPSRAQAEKQAAAAHANGFVGDDEFKEGDHPRAENGQFGSGSGSSSSKEDTYAIGKEAHEAAAKIEPFSMQENAVRNYSSEDVFGENSRPAYADISDSFRKEGKPPPKYAGLVSSIDKAFDGAVTNKPMKVYRGVSGDFSNKLKPGVQFTDNSFMSTSSDPKVALSFGGKMILEIKVPKGAKAISLNGISAEPEEQEILLNRGGTYKITGERTGKEGHRIFEAEFVQ